MKKITIAFILILIFAVSVKSNVFKLIPDNVSIILYSDSVKIFWDKIKKTPHWNYFSKTERGKEFINNFSLNTSSIALIGLTWKEMLNIFSKDVALVFWKFNNINPEFAYIFNVLDQEENSEEIKKRMEWFAYINNTPVSKKNYKGIEMLNVNEKLFMCNYKSSFIVSNKESIIIEILEVSSENSIEKNIDIIKMRKKYFPDKRGIYAYFNTYNPDAAYILKYLYNTEQYSIKGRFLVKMEIFKNNTFRIRTILDTPYSRNLIPGHISKDMLYFIPRNNLYVSGISMDYLNKFNKSRYSVKNEKGNNVVEFYNIVKKQLSNNLSIMTNKFYKNFTVVKREKKTSTNFLAIFKSRYKSMKASDINQLLWKTSDDIIRITYNGRTIRKCTSNKKRYINYYSIIGRYLLVSTGQSMLKESINAYIGKRRLSTTRTFQNCYNFIRNDKHFISYFEGNRYIKKYSELPDYIYSLSKVMGAISVSGKSISGYLAIDINTFPLIIK